MIVGLTVQTNALAFFGKDLGKRSLLGLSSKIVKANPKVSARNEAFLHSALKFIEDTLRTAETVRLLPKFMTA